jgi:cation transport ATPase
MAAAEQQSAHPMAQALVAAAADADFDPEPSSDGASPDDTSNFAQNLRLSSTLQQYLMKSEVNGYETLKGEGISVAVDGRRIYVGNNRLAERSSAWDGQPCSRVPRTRTTRRQ